MKIFVDADACPNVIKDILFRAAERTKTSMIFVANQFLNIPKSMYLTMFQVPKGFDVADNYIVDKIVAGDLVITGDIPLANAVIEKKGLALNPRGQFYTENNIKQLLAMRNFMDSLRSSGVNTGGPSELSQRDRQAFANALDSFLMRNKQ